MENQNQPVAPGASGPEGQAPANSAGQVIAPGGLSGTPSPGIPSGYSGSAPSAAPKVNERPIAVANPGQTPGVLANGQYMSANSREIAGMGKKRFGKKALVALAAVLVLLGGSAAAYLGYYLPNKPENVLAKAAENSLEAHQAKITGLLDITSSGISSRVDYTIAMDEDNHATDIKADTTISGVKIPLELMTVKGNLYFKIGDLSTIESLINGFVAANSPDVMKLEKQINSKITNQWIEVDNTLIKEAKIGCLMNYPTAVSQTDIQSLAKSYSGSPFVTINSHSPDTVNGADAIKYELQINDNKLAGVDLSGAGYVKNLNSCLKSIDPASSVDLSSFKDNDTTPITLWVDKSDKKIVKFASQSTAKDKTNGVQGALSGTITYGDVNIQPPAKSVPLLKLLSDLGLGDIFNSFTSSYTGVQLKARDTERETDINAMQSMLEVYYADHGYYPTLANLNDLSWVAANIKGGDKEALKDPQGTSYALAGQPADHVYSYQVTPTGCDNTATQCQHYTLTATLEAGGTYAKKSLN